MLNGTWGLPWAKDIAICVGGKDGPEEVVVNVLNAFNDLRSRVNDPASTVYTVDPADYDLFNTTEMSKTSSLLTEVVRRSGSCVWIADFLINNSDSICSDVSGGAWKVWWASLSMTFFLVIPPAPYPVDCILCFFDCYLEATPCRGRVLCCCCHEWQ